MTQFGKIKTGSLFLDKEKDIVWVKTRKEGATTLKDNSFGYCNFAKNVLVIPLSNKVINDYLLNNLDTFLEKEY